MTLYFENSQGARRVIGNPNNQEELFKMIHNFLDEHNYKSYYTRTWTRDNGETVYDVGSHTEFFISVE